jgi:hypothetical protein
MEQSHHIGESIYPNPKEHNDLEMKMQEHINNSSSTQWFYKPVNGW